MGTVTPIRPGDFSKLKTAETRRFTGNIPFGRRFGEIQATLPPLSVIEEIRTLLNNRRSMYVDPYTYGDLSRFSPHPGLAFAGLCAPEKTMYGICTDAQKNKIHLVPAGIGTNRGPTHKILQKAEDRLLDAYIKAGNRPLVLVGHSLGGLTAHYLANKYPHMVRMVITLGSPVASSAQDYQSHTSVALAHEIMKLIHHATDGKVLHRDTLHHTRPEHERQVVDYERVFIGAECDRIVDPEASVLVGSGNWTSIIIPKINHAGLLYDPTVISIIVDAITLNPRFDLATRLIESGKYMADDLNPSGSLFESGSGVLCVELLPPANNVLSFQPRSINLGRPHAR